VFNVDFHKLLQLLLPVALRQPRLIAYLKVLAKPLITLFNSFTTHRLYVLDAITHTGQVIYLEHLLNKLYDPFNHIKIIDSTDPRPDVFIFNEAEGQQAIFLFNKIENAPILIYNRHEFDNNNDFIVKVPNGLFSLVEQITATVHRYRQAGKRFIIQTYNVIP
jgi:hypothetical protein